MKIDRLFSIVNILVSKKTVTAKELADEFDVSIRTIYRDIEILSANGVPVFSSQGKGGGISIMDGYSIDKTLVSDNEQKQILMALESVNATGQVDVKESLVKLGGLFKKNEVNWLQIDFSPWSQNENDKIIFESIKNSIFNKQKISFLYFNTKGETSNRIVEPYKLVFKANYWYLYGFCTKRNDMRYFKLTRIEELKILDETFIKRQLKEEKYTYEESNNNIDIKLKIDGFMGFRVYDEFRRGTIKMEEDYFIVNINVPYSDWIYGYLLSFGNAVEVLEPANIREEYIKKVKNILKNYL